LKVPGVDHPKLNIELATDGQHGDFLLKVFLNGQLAREKIINTAGEMVTEVTDVPATAGQTVDVRIEFHANEWSTHAAYVRTIEIN